MNISYKNNVLSTIKLLKYPTISRDSLILPIHNDDRTMIGFLEMFTERHLTDTRIIRCLAAWRAEHAWWFPAQFRVTLVGTRRWAKHQLLEAPDRMLFLVRMPSGKYLGHVGLYRFDFRKKSCEIDNIVRGANDVPGIMAEAIQTMMHWAQKQLGVSRFSLRVFSDNERAVRLYTRLGFGTTKTIPLYRSADDGVVRWEESKKSSDTVQRYYLAMERKGAP